MSYIVITGPTASGKTHKAVALARAVGGEIISADSRQVFKGMDIGSGKDISEYGSVPYHLIDIRPAGYKYNLYEFLRDEFEARAKIISRGHTPILCGGTGLYVESVIKGVQLPEVPENTELRTSLCGKSMAELADILGKMKMLHNVTDLDTAQRAIRAIEIQQYYEDHPDEALAALTPQPLRDCVVISIFIDRDSRRQLISTRLKKRLDDGMVDEVRRLLDDGVNPQALINYGLEYKYLTLYLTGHLEYNEMVRQLEIAIHQFAKRQMTWFRGMERRGITLHWFPWDAPEDEFIDFTKTLIMPNETSC